MAKVVQLPDAGQVLVCTDLQGNIGDLRAMVACFLRELATEPRTHLVFAGDLLHGPVMHRSHWDPWLGEYYVEDSIGVFFEVRALMAAYPGRVHVLLGNHEHGHAGGAHTAKFFPDEVRFLEDRMSADWTEELRAFCADLPLVAVAQHAGLVVTHAAPAAAIDSAADIEAVDYDMSGIPWRMDAIMSVPVLGPLTWARSCSGGMAREFLRALVGRPSGIAVFGHDVAPRGWEVCGDGEQLCLSTSFGVYDCHKTYLKLSLSRRWQSATELTSEQLKPLFPDAPARQMARV